MTLHPHLIGIVQRTLEGKQIIIAYFPLDIVSDFNPIPHILVQEKLPGDVAQGPSLPPKEMLEYRPRIYAIKEIEGQKCIWPTSEHEPPGWFARRCEEANCSWFVPMVERMAAGEEVSLEEIESAYRLHNDGKEMPKGTWGELQSRGQV